MSHLLEILGRGLLAELRSAFAELFCSDPLGKTAALHDRAAREPNCGAHHRSLGVHLLGEGQLRQARHALERALQIDERDEIAGLGLACVFDEQGQKQIHVTVLVTPLMGRILRRRIALMSSWVSASSSTAKS